MAKLAVRFLLLSIFAASLPVTSIITQAEAATTSSKHVMKKRNGVVHHSPRLAGPAAASPYPRNYDDDFDRKAAGGGY
jgi:hypothetical protein